MTAVKKQEKMRLPVERVFASFVHGIEIEISSACNRRCSYCPQSEVQRSQELLPLALFEKMIVELKAINYGGAICFHQYNEPLLVPDHLFACMSCVRKHLPRAALHLYSNGDLLTPELFKKFVALHMEQISLTCHTNKDDVWDYEKALGKIFLKCAALELPCNVSGTKSGLDTVSLVDKTQISIGAHDFMSQGSHRMHSVHTDNEKKESPQGVCAHLLHNMHIAYNGTAYLCCDCCAGVPGMERYALGSAKESSIFELYESKYSYLREFLFGEIPAACRTCRAYC